MRGNQALFTTEVFRKAVYNSSRLRNKFWKVPIQENEKLCKKKRSKCVSTVKEASENISAKLLMGAW